MGSKEKPDVAIPGYDFIREIGAGSMARVFVATQQSLARQVAIKVLRKSLSGGDDFERRFLNEGRLLATLNHPNIVAIYDIGRTQDANYIAMEYLRGGTLTQRVRSGLSLAEALRICTQVAHALDLAHRHNIVHRDLKPSNVMFRDEMTPVLSDFGIARKTDVDQGLTKVGMVVGTPHYMSPEQCKGKRIDGRSDLYSLGVMLYELMTGELPFRAEDQLALAIQHVQEPPPPLPDDSRWLQPIIDRMLAKKPENRFPTMLDFCGAIKERIGSTGGLAQDLKDVAKLFNSDQFSDLSTAPTAMLTARADRPSPAIREGLSARLRRWLGSDRRKRRRLDSKADQTMVASAESLAELDAKASRSQAVGSEATSLLPAQGAPAADLPVALVVSVEDDPGWQGRRVDIQHFPFSVGRDQSADLALPGDPSLSRRHVEIQRSESEFRVVVLSRNGINLSGRRLSRGTPEPLLFSDNLVLSERVSMKFVARMDALPDLVGTVLDERYELEERLHSSIKASTFAARDLRLPKKRLAIKVLAPGLRTLMHYSDTFQRQAEVAAELSHPHIAGVLDLGQTVVQTEGDEHRVPYICMECMSGGNLEAKLANDRPDLDWISFWLEKIGPALEYAHEANIVHGALKPSAIVFDEKENPYLTDFALSCREGESAGPTVVGSPSYIAPEQWEGKTITRATDQYALAVLAYRMVSGSLPFEGQNNPEIRRRNQSRPPLPVNEEAAENGIEGVPASLTSVLNKALSTRPEDRYDSIGQFVTAFKQALGRGMGDRDPKVFISYQRSTGAAWAQLFARVLKENHGISPYFDMQALDRAVRFPERLKAAITDSDVFVCIIGPETLESAWVNEEVRIAHQLRKPMIPVFQETFKHPPADEDLPEHLRALLSFDGVHLLDRRNIHVEHTLEDLARIVTSTMRGQ